MYVSICLLAKLYLTTGTSFLGYLLAGYNLASCNVKEVGIN